MQFVQRLKDSLGGLEKMYAIQEGDIDNQVGFYVYAEQIQKAIEVNKGKLGRVSETPKLMKKVSVMVLSPSDKLIELGYSGSSSGHRKTMSKMISPTNSARSSFQSGQSGQ